MGHEVPSCPFCHTELKPGLDALDEHLEQCNKKTPDGHVYQGDGKDENEAPDPESLQE